MSFVDQGFIGLSALLINLVLARYLSVVAFASLTVMIGAHFFLFGVHRSVIVLPFILDDSSGSEAKACERQRAWWSASLVCIGIILVVLVVAATTICIFARWTPSASWAADVAVLLVFTTPPLLGFEYGRRVLYQHGRAGVVTAMSIVYFFVGMLTALGGMWVGSEFVSSLAFAAAGGSGFAIFLVTIRPRAANLKKAWSVWRPHAAFGAWQVFTSIPYTVYAVSPIVLIGVLAGPIAAAVFGAARTIVSPAFSIVSAIDSLDKPRAARAMSESGLLGLHASIVQTRILLIVLSGSYLGLLIITAPWVMEVAFGPKYGEHSTAVRLLAVAFFCMCLNQPIETMLIVLRKSQVIFAVRMTAAVAVSTGIWFGEYYDGVDGAILAIVFVHIGVLTTLSLIEIKIMRDSIA